MTDILRYVPHSITTASCLIKKHASSLHLQVYTHLLFLHLFTPLQLSFCGKVMPKLYCVNMELVKNSCRNAQYISTVGLAILVLFIVPQLVMIVFSYTHILRVCRTFPKESQANAFRTCVPHLLSLLNYTIASLFEVIQTRFNMSHVAVEAQIFLSLYFIIIPPIANPVLYGLGTQTVRGCIMKLFIKNKVMTTVLAKTLTVG